MILYHIMFYYVLGPRLTLQYLALHWTPVDHIPTKATPASQPRVPKPGTARRACETAMPMSSRIP